MPTASIAGQHEPSAGRACRRPPHRPRRGSGCTAPRRPPRASKPVGCRDGGAELLDAVVGTGRSRGARAVGYGCRRAAARPRARRRARPSGWLGPHRPRWRRGPPVGQDDEVANAGAPSGVPGRLVALEPAVGRRASAPSPAPRQRGSVTHRWRPGWGRGGRRRSATEPGCARARFTEQRDRDEVGLELEQHGRELQPAPAPTTATSKARRRTTSGVVPGSPRRSGTGPLGPSVRAPSRVAGIVPRAAAPLTGLARGSCSENRATR